MKERADPARILSLEHAWCTELNRHFRALRKAVMEGCNQQGVGFAPTTGPITVNAYAFATNPEKLRGFARWVDTQIDAKLLIAPGGPTRIAETHWSRHFVDSAYKKGMARAIQELKQRKNTAAVRRAAPASSVLTLPKAIDFAFLGPTHLDRVQALFIRQYESLKGITKGMSAKIGNTLADGMLKGDGPYTMARALAKDIDISRVRARVIARTEVARAHNVGLVNTYREAGIEGVEVVAEFATAGDDRVCPHCQRLEDISKKKPFPLDKAEGLIPVHPNCRCTLIPIVTGLTKSRTEETEDDVLDAEAEQS